MTTNQQRTTDRPVRAWALVLWAGLALALAVIVLTCGCAEMDAGRLHVRKIGVDDLAFRGTYTEMVDGHTNLCLNVTKLDRNESTGWRIFIDGAAAVAGGFVGGPAGAAGGFAGADILQRAVSAVESKL